MGRNRGAVVTCTLATFLVNVDNTSFSVALPEATDDLGASPVQAQWFVNAYVLTLAAGVTAAGALGDRFRKKLVLLAGLAIYVLGSVCTLLAPTAETLIASRVTAGIGAAALVPLGLALVRDLSETPEQMRANTALWGAVVGIGMAAGPLVGGAATTFGSWRLIGVFSAVLGMVFLCAAAALLPAGRANPQGSLDWLGQALLSISAITFVYGLTAAGHGAAPFIPLVSFTIAAAAVIGLVAHLRRAADPIVPAAARTSILYRLGLSSGVTNYACLGGAVLFTSLLLQDYGDVAAVTAGLVIVTLAVATTVGGWLSGRILATTSPGAALVFAGTAITIGCLVGGIGTALWGVGALIASTVAALTCAGIGMGVGNSATNLISMTGLAREHSGRAGAFASASRQLGQAIGISAISILVAAHSLDSAIAAAVPWLVLAVGAILVVLVGIGVRHHEQTQSE